ncbi:MAG: chorismate mutase [Sulfolobaceae archaeon]|nr:chorismate mutase [Sulfolobaceae archaeon]
MMEEINLYREKIDEIDQQILQLLKSRIELAKKIGEIKRKNGLPILDETREQNKINELNEFATRIGLPSKLVNEVYREIIKWSRVVQVNTNAKNVVIIGTGKMAETLTSLISYGGHKVAISHIFEDEAVNLSRKLNVQFIKSKEISEFADYVILAVAPEALNNPSFIESLKFLRGKIVMDIFSTKHNNYTKLKKLSIENGFTFISTHPLFGPSYLPVGERIVIIDEPEMDEKLKEQIIAFWKELGLTPVLMSLDYHDKLMAVIQVIPHFLLLSMKSAISRLANELNVELKNEYFTTNFRQIYEILNRIDEIKQVIFEIQVNNPYSESARKISLDEVNKMYNILSQAGDKFALNP